MLDYCKGLRIYGVYSFVQYPDWKVFVTDILVSDDIRYLEGLAFDENGNMETKVTLKLPIEGKEIGYAYRGNFTVTLK